MQLITQLNYMFVGKRIRNPKDGKEYLIVHINSKGEALLERGRLFWAKLNIIHHFEMVN